MFKTLVPCLVIAACVLAFRPAVAQESKACMAAVARLEVFLMAQPAACQTSVDCSGYYYRADPCADPVVLPRDGAMQPEFMQKLVMLQMEARGLCMKAWSARPACSAPVFKAVCVKNKCVDAAP